MANPSLGYLTWTNLLAMARAKVRPAAGDVTDAQLQVEINNAIREILADTQGLPSRAYLKTVFTDNVRSGEWFSFTLNNSVAGEVQNAVLSLYSLNSNAVVNFGSIEAISLGDFEGICSISFVPAIGAWCVSNINATYADTEWTVTVAEVDGAPLGVVDRVFGGTMTNEVLVQSELSSSEYYPIGNPRPYLKQVCALPAGFMKIHSVYYDYDYKLLEERNWDDLIDGNLTGTPLYYAIKDSSMILYPWPSEMKPICVDYGGCPSLATTTTLSQPANTELPQFLYAAITYQVASRVLSSYGEYRLAKTWEARYKRIRSSCVQWIRNQNPEPTNSYERANMRVIP